MLVGADVKAKVTECAVRLQIMLTWGQGYRVTGLQAELSRRTCCVVAGARH